MVYNNPLSPTFDYGSAITVYENTSERSYRSALL